MLKCLIKKAIPFGVVEWYKARKAGQHEFKKNFFSLSKSLEDGGRFVCQWKDRYPCLADNITYTPFEPHYTYHPAWGARILAATRPEVHVDISSSLSFVTIVSAFIPIEFYDFRPAHLHLNNLTSKSVNILSLPFDSNSLPSISCMHVVEHIGLGRYGDPHDPQGDIKAMQELQRVVAPNGQLLFVVPVAGKSMIQYNAHRIYLYNDIVGQFPKMDLKSFSLITDDGKFLENADQNEVSNQKWGCGCFHFIKRGC